MKKLILKQEVIDKIRKDPILFGTIAHTLGITPMSLPRVLSANSVRLTEALVLQELRNHLKITNDSDLFISPTENVAA